jgi:hypothetical protein
MFFTELIMEIGLAKDSKSQEVAQSERTDEVFHLTIAN